MITLTGAEMAAAFVDSLAWLMFIKVSALIVVAFAANAALRSASAATRSATWTALAVALLALPLVSAVVPRAYVQLPAAFHLPPPTSPSVLASPTVDPAIPAEAERHTGTIAARAARLAPAGFVLVWLTGAALLLGGLARGSRRVRDLRRRARRVPAGTAASTQLNVLVGNLGMSRRIELLTSRDVDVPITGGLFRPFIVLPDDLVDWSAQRLRIVLLHEVAHVARWDYAAHILFELMRAVYWPNPLAWRAMASATSERERAVDDRVIVAGTDPAAYAAELLAFAATGGRPASTRATVALGPSAFRTRLKALLGTGPNRGLTSRRHQVSIAAMMTFGLLAAGSVSGARPPRSVISVAVASTTSGVEGRVRLTSQDPRTASEHLAHGFLPRLGDARRDSLLHVLVHANHPRERRSAARALRRDGSETPVVAVLTAALADTCHGGRWLATRAFRELGAERAVPRLVHQLLVDEHPAVRAMAANAIATSGLTQGAALLRAGLSGAPRDQFGRVGRAIDTLGDTPAHTRLLAALRAAR